MWISDVTFAGNIAKFAGGAIFIDFTEIDKNLRMCDATFFMIGLLTSAFIQNTAYSGGTAVYIRAPVDSNVFQMTIVSTIFHRNFNPDDILQRKYDCAVLYLSCVDGITIMNSTFSDNNCTSVLAESSTFHL